MKDCFEEIKDKKEDRVSKTIHDKIAERLAKKFGTEYKKSKGIDIVTKNKVIEVETKKESIYQSINQVKNLQSKIYCCK